MRAFIEILYVIDDLEPRYPRDQNYILKYMIERGHSVSVITSRNPEAECHDNKIYPGARISRYPNIMRIGTVKIYAPNPLKLVTKPDMVHTFTFYTFSTLAALLTRARVRVIRSEISHPKARRVRRGLTTFRILTEIYKVYYNVVTAYNEREVESLRILGFPRERILLLPPMIDVRVFKSARREPDEIPVLGTLSRISPEKGIHELPKILENLDRLYRKDYRFILAGKIWNRLYGEAVISRLKKALGERFTYLGEVENPLEFHRMVDVFIFTSSLETGAIAVLEAMAAGKLVVSRKTHPADLYIGNDENGILFESPEEAAEKLSRILTNRRDLKNLQDRAVRYAENHDYRRLCLVLEKAYEALKG
jgi:glycosyltransferase involved in cell wall biosynthesis